MRTWITKWTDAEDEQLIKELYDKLPISEIAKKHERTEAAITFRIYKIIGSMNKSPNEIAKLTNLSVDKVKSIILYDNMFGPITNSEHEMNNKLKRWTNNEKEQLIQELFNKLSLDKMAENHKRSASAIMQYLRKTIYEMNSTKTPDEIAKITNLSVNEINVLIDLYAELNLNRYNKKDKKDKKDKKNNNNDDNDDNDNNDDDDNDDDDIMIADLKNGQMKKTNKLLKNYIINYHQIKSQKITIDQKLELFFVYVKSFMI